MKAFLKRFFTGTLALLIILSAAASAAAQDGVRTVKAGFFAFPGYHELEDGARSGYGYEFLALLSRYTDLNFEYVGYENSWEDMQRMLLDGGIDLVTSARKTLDREEIFDFSEPIGTNSAQINVRADDERFIPGDYAALNGITVGILSGNSRNADMKVFAGEKGFVYDTVTFGDAEELQRALFSGEVDAIVTSSLRKSAGEKTIAEFAPESFYVIVRKGDRALLNEINYGISQMDANEGNWRSDLYYENYETGAGAALSFTSRETACIQAVQNGEKTITVYVQPDADPYSFVENGALTGIIPDYFAHLMETAGLPYTLLIPTDESPDQTTAARADIIIECRDSGAGDPGSSTDPCMQMTTSRVTRKGFSDTIRSIAAAIVPETEYIGEDIAEDVKYITVDTPAEAMLAVKDGRADACCVYTCTADKFINADPDGALQATVLKSPVFDVTFRIDPDSDHALCSILNKCIKADTPGALDGYIKKYTSISIENLSVVQYLRLHPLYVFIGSALLALLIGLIIAAVIRGKNAKLKADQLERELEQQNQLQEALYSADLESKRNGLLLDIFNAGKWTYEISADDRVLAANYSRKTMRQVDNEYRGEPMRWVELLHPEDKEAAVEQFTAAIRDHSGKTPYDAVFRLMGGDGKYRWMKSAGSVIRRADGSGEFYGMTMDITEQVAEQQKKLLGAVPLSPDILSKANIGMWAFELDEGREPRMYADRAMLPLIGLDHPVSPEETYHAWYDHIDRDSYPIFTDAVARMTAGEHAEVQYPWHHPDGRTIMVRFGGVRNPEYTKGIRIEGTHQDVSEVVHFDEEEIIRHRETEVKLRHEQLRSEVLNYMIDNDDDPIELLKNYAERVRVLIDCDQVIYRDLEETRIMVNSPAIEETWHVPIEYCRQCEHFDAHHPMYAGGYTEMDNCQEGWQGIPVYHDCPIKSSLTRIVYCDGEVAGYLAIHYVQGYHHFTDTERATLEEFTRILSVSLSRYKARQENRELKLMHEMQEKIEESNRIISALASDFSCVNYVELTDDRENDATVNYRTSEVLRKLIPGWEAEPTFPAKIRMLADHAVFEPDREQFLRNTKREKVLEGLKDSDICYINTRLLIEGEIRYYQFRFSAIRDADGKVTGVVTGLHSVDEQMRREIEAQEQLQNLLDDAREANLKLAEQSAFTRYFLEPYLSAYYIGFSDLSCQVYKRTAELEENYPIITNYMDSLTEYIDREVHPDDREEFRKLIRPEKMKVLLSAQPEFSYTFRTVAGGREEYCRFQAIRGADEDHAAFGFRNITEEIRKQREEEKRLEEALAMAQSANRAKTTFLNNMSHDIRTPMNAIIGYTGLAASHIDHKEQVRDYLAKISQSSDHLLSLINDVLDMSRIESGKMNLDEKPENLSDIIHTLRDIVQADVHAKQLDFFVDAVDVNDEDIVCDKLRLNQVLLNVLSNAVKYTPSGGTVTLRIREDALKANGYASYEFRIKDNGMGMDGEFLKTIFDPFTRVKSSTVSGIQGTGLGMAITKNIIDMMGGRIDIDSEPGKGTEVTIRFDFMLQSAPKAPETIPELQGVKALVADDDTNTCISVYNMLRDIGMRGEWCASGKEAVIRAGEAHRIGDAFKVYIIDWLMPDMNGIETTRRIRKVIGEDAPVIILTAYDWSDIEDEAREAGVTAFVSKPMFPSDLRRVLGRCLGKSGGPEKKEEVKYDFKGRRILLVEDNEMNREIAQDILSEDGFVLDTAEDGSIALEKMRNAQPGDYDLVLMDVQMPVMNGYEATRRIRALGTDISKIPIIAMTANAFEEDRKAALDAGMDEHIAKPIDIEKLKETIAKFL